MMHAKTQLDGWVEQLELEQDAKRIIDWQPCYLAGRCHDGAQKDGGVLWHAVAGWKALCGAEPGRRSAGWAPWDEAERVHEVTCPRCKKALAKLGGDR